MDLITLSLYDIVVFCDDSGSMAFDQWNGSRLTEMRRIVSRVSEIATVFDDDGLTVRFFNSPLQGNNIKNAAMVDTLMAQLEYKYATPMGTELFNKVVDPLCLSVLPKKKGFFSSGTSRKNAFLKPMIVYTITDGEPYGEPEGAVLKTITKTCKKVEEAGFGRGVAFQFAQVGMDEKANEFLNMLDNNGDIGKCVDTTAYYELEWEEFKKKGVDLTPDLWTVKMMLGSIDPDYDNMD